MSSALSIAAGGIRTASQQFQKAATQIVQAGANASEQVSNPVTGTSGGAPVSLATPPLPDLAQSVVDLKLAEISYKANAKVFSVASRLEDELLNILA